jgi:hypothetical protein
LTQPPFLHELLHVRAPGCDPASFGHSMIVLKILVVYRGETKAFGDIGYKPLRNHRFLRSPDVSLKQQA